MKHIKAVASLGLTFRVRSSTELHPTYIGNLLFLEYYFDMLFTVPMPVHQNEHSSIGMTPQVAYLWGLKQV